MEDLNTTFHGLKEGLMDYVKHFKILVLDYYKSKYEKQLFYICICNMINNQRVFLENYDISSFSSLVEKPNRTVLFVKAPSTFIKS